MCGLKDTNESTNMYSNEVQSKSSGGIGPFIDQV